MSLGERFARWRTAHVRVDPSRLATLEEREQRRTTRRKNLIDSRRHPTPERLAEEIAWRRDHGLEATEEAAWAARRDRRGERCRDGGAWLTQRELAQYEEQLESRADGP